MHFLLMLILLIILAAVTNLALISYTKHGEMITVPDLTDLHLDQVSKVLSNKNLNYKIIDSAFVVEKDPETVISQYPLANKFVKENRKIYLTINANNAPELKMPDLIDKSFRYAEIEIKNIGLKLGDVKFEPDLAKNAVLKQLINGKKVVAGEMVKKGSTVDLVLGDGFGSVSFQIPNLKGLSFQQARFYIEASSLKLGAIVPDKSVIDTSTAIVFKQGPEYASGRLVKIGEDIDLFITHKETYDKLYKPEIDKQLQNLRN